MRKEVKLYAIQLKNDEAMKKIADLNRLTHETGYSGVYVEYPFIYVTYKDNDTRINAFHKFGKVFNHCKIVRNAMYADEKYILKNNQ